MKEKLSKLKKCTTRIDFLNILFPGEGSKNEYLKVIFSVPDEKKYSTFTIRKKSGGTREISAPREDLKKIQKKLGDFLSECYQELYGDKNNYANAYLKEKSIITNAKKHRNKRYVLNIDLENFFPSITFGRVRNYFIKNKYFELTEEIATLIAKIACYKGILPQGSPCSPIISNFICQILDIRLGKLASKNKCHYSRYADDITFSTNLMMFPENIAHWNGEKIIVGQELGSEVTRAGFNCQHSKTRIYGKDKRQEVTSLTVNRKVNVSRKYFDSTKAMARKYYLTGTCEINGQEATYKQILGRFNYINQLEKYNNKIFFKQNEAKEPENIFTPANEKPLETNQKDSVIAPVQLTNNSKYHTFAVNGSKEKELGKYGYKVGYNYLSAREQAYSKFLYYSTFIVNQKPIILTEGKTDILYLKAAIKNLYLEFPNLVEKSQGNFNFKISFYNYSKLNRYLLNIIPSGGGILRVLTPQYLFPSDSLISNHPTILLLDNEEKEGKPLSRLLGNGKLKKEIVKKDFASLDKTKITLKGSDELFNRVNGVDKFFILAIPRIESDKESDIENLFTEDFIKEQEFDRKNKGAKNELSKIVSRDYKKIDFTNFKPLLENLTNIVQANDNK